MNKSRLVSFAIHSVIIASVLLFGTVVHKVLPTPVLYQSALVLPMDLPAPNKRPITQIPSSTPALLGSAPSLLKVNAASPEAAPQTVKLDASGPLALPQVAQSVIAAPVARQVGFGNPMPAAGHSSGSVSTAGFGQHQTGTAQGQGGVRVVAAGFNVAQSAAPVVVRTAEPAIVPPVVTFEPKPQYTESARAAHISGEVVLRVRFTAEGTVKVLGLVQGLGHGLDDSAIKTAETMRFVPATRDGQPVSFETLVRITFQLAQ
jgi:TonB family protein